MSTYTQLIYQIIFSPQNHTKVLIKENRIQLLKYITTILKANSCFVYSINGVSDHIHIATGIHPAKSLSAVVADIKRSTSIWIKRESVFPEFKFWHKGYGAFTYSMKDKDYLINYIKNQEIHHKQITFKEEYISLLTEFGVDYDERYL